MTVTGSGDVPKYRIPQLVEPPVEVNDRFPSFPVTLRTEKFGVVQSIVIDNVSGGDVHEIRTAEFQDDEKSKAPQPGWFDAQGTLVW